MTREESNLWKNEIAAFQEGKTIQVKINGGWEDSLNPSFSNGYKFRVKPEPAKRLPTIQEVEQWFLENRVFVYKEKNILNRITAFDRNNRNGELVSIAGWKTIEMFCEEYTHLDGSSLYINENGK